MNNSNTARARAAAAPQKGLAETSTTAPATIATIATITTIASSSSSNGTTASILGTPPEQKKLRCNTCSRPIGSVACTCSTQSNQSNQSNHPKRNNPKKTKKKRSPINPETLNSTLHTVEHLLLHFNSFLPPPPTAPPPTSPPTSPPPPELTPTTLEASIARSRAALHIFMTNVTRVEKKYTRLTVEAKQSGTRCNGMQLAITQLEEEIALVKLSNTKKSTDGSLPPPPPTNNDPAFPNDSDAYRKAVENRVIEIDGTALNMTFPKDFNALVTLAEEDHRIYAFIERKMKARQRKFLADTLLCTNAIAYMQDESLYVCNDTALNQKQKTKRGQRGGRRKRREQDAQ